MGTLSNNLSRSEFECSCCDFDTVDHELVEILQDLCDDFAVTYHQRIEIRITGPNRCESHNKSIGGAPQSQHIYGRAADFKLYLKDSGQQITPHEIYDHIDHKHPKRLGLGLYSNRVHVDTRTGSGARWNG